MRKLIKCWIYTGEKKALVILDIKPFFYFPVKIEILLEVVVDR